MAQQGHSGIRGQDERTGLNMRAGRIMRSLLCNSIIGKAEYLIDQAIFDGRRNVSSVRHHETSETNCSTSCSNAQKSNRLGPFDHLSSYFDVPFVVMRHHEARVPIQRYTQTPCSIQAPFEKRKWETCMRKSDCHTQTYNKCDECRLGMELLQ